MDVFSAARRIEVNGCRIIVLGRDGLGAKARDLRPPISAATVGLAAHLSPGRRCMYAIPLYVVSGGRRRQIGAHHRPEAVWPAPVGRQHSSRGGAEHGFGVAAAQRPGAGHGAGDVWFRSGG